jgi:hypothetical protein
MADKNLGPCIIEQETYIKNILNEHLQNGNTYQLLQEDDAIDKLSNIKVKLKEILNTYSKEFNGDEKAYFTKLLRKGNHRIPQFYSTPKVHKNKKPTPYRPVISQCGSLSAIISTFIDYKLQKFTKFIPSYVQNSEDLLNTIDQIDTLPKNAKIFTSDATSMYTNIDPEEGIPVLVNYINEYNNELGKRAVDAQSIKELLKLVMYNNIFQFGDSWWIQKIGTAMGTPCACIYATIFFAWFERKFILTKYKDNLLL